MSFPHSLDTPDEQIEISHRWKAALRKVAARSLEALWTAIAQALTAFTPQECSNFFAAAGYDRV